VLLFLCLLFHGNARALFPSSNTFLDSFTLPPKYIIHTMPPVSYVSVCNLFHRKEVDLSRATDAAEVGALSYELQPGDRDSGRKRRWWLLSGCTSPSQCSWSVRHWSGRRASQNGAYAARRDGQCQLLPPWSKFTLLFC
jgi:hypothetical protein